MSVVEEIKERLDIVEVISAYVPLRKAGNLYKGLCPFHQEKTPSFVVYPDRGTWHCFGACGTGGDVFSFVMKRDNLDFREALEVLAQKAGVNLAPPSAARSQQEQYLDRLREINQAAAVYFHHQLRHTPQGQGTRDYLTGRGISDATIDAFLLGYAADRWDGLLAHLQSKNYESGDILAAGLVIEREQPEPGRSPYYDRFRQRVMVPIRDVHGHVIGFGARALRSDQQPKYLNTPQTPLFEKSNVLYGLDAARRSIRPRGKAIIVEGYMDVLACHQAGEDNVVASMGTALTETQIKQLRRYTSTIVLALDADAAGQAATLRGLSQARDALDREWVPVVTATGLVRHEARLAVDLRVMTLPAGKDPDDVVRADVTLWRELVNTAQPVVDYYFELVRSELDLTTAQGKSEAVERLAPLIFEVSDEVKRTHYTQQLARLIQTDERTLERLLLKQRRAAQPAPRPRPADPPPAVWEDAAEAEYPEPLDGWTPRPAARRTTAQHSQQISPSTHCLALLVLHPEMLPDLQAELAALGAGPLDEEDFSQADERAVCAALVTGEFDDAGWSNTGRAEDALLAQLQATARRLPPLSRDQLLEDMLRAVLRLRISNLKARAKTLPALTRSAREEGQSEDVRSYQQIQQSLSQHLRLLEQLLNQRTHAGRRQMTPNL
ncbi:MAG TPA: DNA primase [Anaerolineae bacterium]|nr:DNA primase [Anaerolineae bacterium]